MSSKTNCYFAGPLELFAIMVLSAAAAAQVPINALLAAMQSNAGQLRDYTFKQRTETYHRGELRNTRLEEIHYDASGDRASIPLGEEKVEAEEPRRGPGHRIIARKMEEEKEKMKNYLERLKSLTGRYLGGDPAKLQAAMANAEVTMGGGSSVVRLRIRDYVKTGDSMTMTVDPATKRPVKTEVSTSLDDAPVAIVLTFDAMHDGPHFPGKTVVRADGKQLEIRMFTYDYRK